MLKSLEKLSSYLPPEAIKSLQVLDATKISEYDVCSRKFFMAHVLGLRPINFARDLAFGDAWHQGQAYLDLDAPKIVVPDDVIAHLNAVGLAKKNIAQAAVEIMNVVPDLKKLWEVAVEAYLSYKSPEWDHWSLEEADELFWPKSPGKLALAFLFYLNQKADRPKPLMLNGRKAVEIAGTLDIGGLFPLAFRIDKIVENFGLPIVDDYKTGGAYLGWEYMWQQSVQFDIYDMAAQAVYGQTDGVRIDGCIVTRNQPTPKRGSTSVEAHVTLLEVPVSHSAQQQAESLWCIKDTMLSIDFEIERAVATNNARFMRAFPMRKSQCHFQYGKPCVYRTLCESDGNPWDWMKKGFKPMDMRIEWWNPLEKEAYTTINAKLEGGE